jgi:drug/metabolite transporter (DMT)-like permease
MHRAMRESPHSSPTPKRWQVITAFAAIYLIWGSTYLGIRLAVETIPPFSMAGARAFVAGVILYAWARRRGAGKPELRPLEKRDHRGRPVAAGR